MARSPLRLSLAITACAFTGMATALPAQPARVPASVIGPPAGPLAGHPYKSALGAVWNYQSCGARARRAAYIEITTTLHSIEAAAEAKGLGPTLERLRQEYHALLAVSTMMACARGPRAALAGARGALAAFRTWVDEQPGWPSRAASKDRARR
jgi:hypothetical protein